MRRVINKGVDEADLLRTVETAFAHGWRSVKLYFMCGLPTETDDDVLGIADLAARVIEAGRRASGQRDIRCTVEHRALRAQGVTRRSSGRRRPIPRRSIGGFTCCVTRSALTSAMGRAISMRYNDGKPGQVEGLLSRGEPPGGRGH